MPRQTVPFLLVQGLVTIVTGSIHSVCPGSNNCASLPPVILSGCTGVAVLVKTVGMRLETVKRTREAAKRSTSSIFQITLLCAQRNRKKFAQQKSCHPPSPFRQTRSFRACRQLPSRSSPGHGRMHRRSISPTPNQRTPRHLTCPFQRSRDRCQDERDGQGNIPSLHRG